MFALDEADLKRSLLGCGDGPASFQIECRKYGGQVVSCDPLYQFFPAQIRRRVYDVAPEVLRQTTLNRGGFVWDDIASSRELGQLRFSSMRRFLHDYRAPGSRYIAAALPHLPFRADAFDLALCSHFLFLYSQQLSLGFHLAALREMLRVAGEARVFPLLALDARPSPHLAPVMEQLRAEGFIAKIQRVDYEFQRGGNEMLRVWH